MPNPRIRPASPEANSIASFATAASPCALFSAPCSTTFARYDAMLQARAASVESGATGGAPGSMSDAGMRAPSNPAKQLAALSNHPGTASHVTPESVEYSKPQVSVKRICVAGPGGPSGPIGPDRPRGYALKHVAVPATPEKTSVLANTLILALFPSTVSVYVVP